MHSATRFYPVTVLLVLLAAFSLTTCGYRFSGSGNFPGGVQRIFITIFENKTSEIGVENVLADAVTAEFTARANAAAVAGSRRSADAVLTGRITSVHISSISRITETVTDDARVVITVVCQLTSSDGKQIWTSGEVIATDTYAVFQTDKARTDDNKTAALGRAAVRVSEKIYNKLVEDF